MSRKYKVKDQEKLYFVTSTIVYWIDLFTRKEFCEEFLSSIRYCQENKGLEVYAWCIMPSHIHMILGTNGKQPLQDIIRDFKSFTSRRVRVLLEGEEGYFESRRDWLLWMFTKAGKKNGNNNNFQLWQQHFHPIELSSNTLMDRALTYIHNNPVVAGYAEAPEFWRYSSAIDYCGRGKGLLDILFIE